MTPWPLGTFDDHKPEHIDTLKKNVPDTTIIVGHMAWQRFMDLLTLVWMPRIYIETSNGLNMTAGLYGVDFAERLILRLGALSTKVVRELPFPECNLHARALWS